MPPSGLAWWSDSYFAAADQLMERFHAAPVTEQNAEAGSRILCGAMSELIAKVIAYTRNEDAVDLAVVGTARDACRRFRCWTPAHTPGRAAMLIAAAHSVARSCALVTRRLCGSAGETLRDPQLAGDTSKTIGESLGEALATVAELLETHPDEKEWAHSGFVDTDGATMVARTLCTVSWCCDALSQAGFELDPSLVERVHARVGQMWPRVVQRPAALTSAVQALAHSTSAWSLAIEQQGTVSARLAIKTLWFARQAAGRPSTPALNDALLAVVQSSAAVAGISAQTGVSRDARLTTLSAELLQRLLKSRCELSAQPVLDGLGNLAAATALSAERHLEGSDEALTRSVDCLDRVSALLDDASALRAARTIVDLSEAVNDLCSSDDVTDRVDMIASLVRNVDLIWSHEIGEPPVQKQFHAYLGRAASHLRASCDLLRARGVNPPTTLVATAERLENGNCARPTLRLAD